MSEVFKKLSKIDCSNHIEKKGNLSYLSWAWAWSTLMDAYPSSVFEFSENEYHADGTVTVSCTVFVETINHTMWLPVMDHKNNAIKNPDARKISDSKMRCLVKAIALHGLGLYIYAGEDLPEAEPLPPVELPAISDDKFADMLEKWWRDIAEKGRTAQNIIESMSKKVTLTQEQIGKIVLLEAKVKQEKQNESA